MERCVIFDSAARDVATLGADPCCLGRVCLELRLTMLHQSWLTVHLSDVFMSAALPIRHVILPPKDSNYRQWQMATQTGGAKMTMRASRRLTKL